MVTMTESAANRRNTHTHVVIAKGSNTTVELFY